MKKIIRLLIISVCGFACSKTSTNKMLQVGDNIVFRVNLIHVNEYFQPVIETDGRLICMSFLTDDPTYISFDYDDLYKPTDLCCLHLKDDSLALNKLYSTNKQSCLLVENNDGFIASISCSYPFGTRSGNYDSALHSGNFLKREPDYWQIDGNPEHTYQLPVSIDTMRLYVCNDNPIIRFHYVYVPDRKARIIGAKPMILVSNWVNIRE